MFSNRSLLTLAVAGIFAAGTASAAAEGNNSAELLKRLEQQQAQIDALKKQVADVVTQAEREAATDSSDTWIGGYGELHYNNYEEKTAEFDYHRFVLFFGHKFSDKLRFFSELELEHSLAGEGKKGEVELEQAYIEYQVSDAFNWKAGLFLLPVGILNETHEPPTFYGVERNKIEGDIIPTTWWEAGFGASWRFGDGLALDVAATSGLKVKDDYKIRGGRQKVSEAVGEDLAYTARLKFTGIAGLELAAALQYQHDITQGMLADEAPATLLELHGIYSNGPFGVRALYARWDIDGDGAKALGRDEQAGAYVEPSWRFNDDVGVFVRRSVWDTEAGTSVDSKRKSTQLGVNYWLHPQVVLKADYEWQDGHSNDAGDKFEDEGINLGVGYQF